MKSKYNYTGRIRIPRKNITITLRKEETDAAFLDLHINLSGENLPANALVFIEAYHRLLFKRYPLGTVQDITSKVSIDISDLDYTENLHFRIKIVNTTGKHGLIIAEADNIKLVAQGTEVPIANSILPVNFDLTDHQIWKIEFNGTGPILHINKNIPQIETLTKSDPRFFFYTYPAALREILIHMIFVDRIEDAEDPEMIWQKDWLDFAQKYNKNPLPPLNKTDQDSDDILDWIDEVIKEFCYSKVNEWDRFIKVETDL